MTSSPNQPQSRVDLDCVFRTLSHRLRRHILTALMTDNPRWQDEFETIEFVPDKRQPESYSLTLHHKHLPSLEADGFIEWDQHTGLVNRGKNFEGIHPLLELMDAHKDELPDDWP